MENNRRSFAQRSKIISDCLDLLIQSLEISHEISMKFQRPKGSFFIWLSIDKPINFNADNFLYFCLNNPIKKFPLIEYKFADDRNIIHNSFYSNEDENIFKILKFESGSKFSSHFYYYENLFLNNENENLNLNNNNNNRN